MNKLSLSHPPSQVLRIYLWIQIWTHVLYGVCTLLFIFPFLTQAKRDRRIQKWSRHLLKIFNIDLSVRDASLLLNSPFLMASNHVSWIDIHVINAFRPIRFVAKSEVEGWPIFGWMAKQLGTVFIRRDSSRHARQVVGQMAEVLQGESICIFPEGTSSVGLHVLPFRPNLFESAILAQVPVFPLAIQYISKSTGQRSEAPAFVGDMGLLESIANILSARDLQVNLSVLPAYEHRFETPLDRKQLAIYAQESISMTI